MKYLRSREKFLTEAKQNDQQIFEAFDMSGNSGPFNNDIAWGDSLVGRLINFVIRKVGVGINMVRIQPVIMRLKMEFENLLSSSKTAELDEETKSKIAMVLICRQIRIISLAIVNMKSYGAHDDDETFELKEVNEKDMSDIRKENYLKEVEEIVDEITTSIAATTDQFGKIENYDDLMKTLKELSQVIKIMKKEAEETKPDEEEEPTDIKSLYNENFKAVAQLIIEYQKLKDEAAKKQGKPSATSVEIGKVYNFTDKKGVKKKVQVISLTNSMSIGGDKKWLTADDVKKSPLEKDTASVIFQDKDGNFTSLSPQMSVPVSQLSESRVYEFVDKLSSGDEKSASPILLNIKKMYNTFKQIDPNATQELKDFLSKKPEEQMISKYSSALDRIYKNVKIKSGIKESMISENLDDILTRDNDLAKVISELYKVSKTKPDGNFDGVSPGIKSALVNFNKSMESILKKDSEPTPTKESKLLKYEEFREDILTESLIGKFLGWGSAKIAQLFGYDEKESEELKDEDVSKLKVNKNNKQKVLSLYWEEIYTSKISKILVTQKQYDILCEELVKIKDESEGGDGLIIDGMDPVIGILKCFNRAYKLYTVPVIPGGRTKGAIDRSTFSEYDSFGSSSGEMNAYNGPFRHKKTYNMWESAVLDIMRDRQFQPIFNAGTKLRVGNVMKPGAGTALRQFMTDIMDGSTLYKGGRDSAGAQKQLLEKYFGKESVTDVEEGDTAFVPQEIADNGEMEEKILKSIVEFKKGSLKDIDKIESLKRMIFEVEVEMEKPKDYKEEETDKNKELDATKRYFFPIAFDSDMFYVVFSRKFGNFSKYIENDFLNRERSSTVSFEPGSLKTSPQSDIFLTKMKSNDFKKLLRPGDEVNLQGQIHGTTDKKYIGKQTTKSVKFLYVESESKEKIYNLEKYNTEGTKGFKEEELKSHSPQST